MTTKSESAALVAKGVAFETFQHVTLGHFNVTLLRFMIENTLKLRPQGLPLMRCRFSEMRMVDGIAADPFAYLTANREIDPARVASLTQEQIDEPLIFLHCPPGANGVGETHLLIDGIHRLCRRKADGLKYFNFYLVPMFQAPMVDETQAVHIPWGEKDVVPGVGLLARARA